MRNRKRRISIALLAILALAVSGCGWSGSRPVNADESAGPATGDITEQITLSVFTNIGGEAGKVLEEIAKQFMRENPEIKVEFNAPGAEYENIMKVKMASDELPDVFSTHGWAKIRYGKHLADLRNEPWASQIEDAIKSVVTDETGKVYVLPIDQDKAGPIYNAEILEKYGVAVPRTIDEFIQAAETIKEQSGGQITPIHIGGVDGWPIGQFFDFFSTSLLISPQTNFREQLLDGTFDWRQYDKLPEIFLELQNRGLLNRDVLTSKYTDSVKSFAEGKTAFGIYAPFLIEDVRKINPNLKAGLMPIPSMVEGDMPTFAGGERTTWGIWKDSPHPEAAKKFVAYYATPENVAKVAAANVLPPGLSDIEINAGDLTQYFEQYQDTRVFPYFDRVYLPNGMWVVMCRNGQDLLAGAITPSDYSDHMEKEYHRLRKAQGL